jgi:hypothetical protein
MSGLGSHSSRDNRFFSPPCPDQFGVHLFSLLMVPLFCHRRKVVGNDVNHFPPSSSKVKNKWSCTFTPPQYLHGMDGDKLQLLWFHDVCVCVCVCACLGLSLCLLC